MDARVRHAALIALLALAIGCDSASPPPRRASAPSPRPPSGAHVEELPPEALADEPAPPPIADPAAAEAAQAALEPPPRVIQRAPAPDSEYASDEPVDARRYVYRVTLVVPETLGADRSDLAIPAAELFVDVSAERLRARFVGPGWPVEAGSEVRVRGDSPGSYVFDREGGRSLPPGALAEWFEGGPRRTGPPLSVRRDPAHTEREIPGGLICALLAEWSGDLRENVMRRCDGRAPMAFRVGFWRAERTADVPVELPRRALRADESDPPPPVPITRSRAFLEPAALSRVPPMDRPPRDLPERDPTAPAEGLDFVNESDARVVVAAEGVALGWVDAGASGLFVGLRPGAYRIAALRPLGAVVLRPRVVVVPGRTVLGARRVRDDEL
ncbi:hypothetical protein [Sandaracinus amylolyticus]|uniref:Carboxypeptidase regulatory-like domain-containing protein n=1 Tax=Sandaracinus amylolyticus TaxID=927083 RepID=A0A0F6W9A1_9BACT|nr:hypothetical protein [Sandaracinus amylolyticus]AKF10667.1 hypothetical protein DB32_007816 [Sandaracinus amylolyticus]